MFQTIGQLLINNMSLLNRRKFLKKSFQTFAVIGAGISSTNLLMAKVHKTHMKDVSAVIPKPIQVVIDDVGWWSGKDGSKYQEPYRTGINRNHVLPDFG